MAKYKHLAVKTISLSEMQSARSRTLTPRQKAQLERDDEIRAAINEAAALPASEAVVIDLKDGQKMPTLRAAVTRIFAAEPRDLNWGIRNGNTQLIISKGVIPGGRGKKA